MELEEDLRRIAEAAVAPRSRRGGAGGDRPDRAGERDPALRLRLRERGRDQLARARRDRGRGRRPRAGSRRGLDRSALGGGGGGGRREPDWRGWRAPPSLDEAGASGPISCCVRPAGRRTPSACLRWKEAASDSRRRPNYPMRSLGYFAAKQAESVQEAQREQFATLTLNTAVELTAAALSGCPPTGSCGRAGDRAPRRHARALPGSRRVSVRPPGKGSCGSTADRRAAARGRARRPARDQPARRAVRRTRRRGFARPGDRVAAASRAHSARGRAYCERISCSIIRWLLSS